MKKITAAKLSSDVSTIIAPAGIKILDFKQHLDGPRIWFESDDSDEKISYLVKRVHLGGKGDIPANVIEFGQNCGAFYKTSLPQTAIIAGVRFDDDWRPIMFILVPNSETGSVEQEFLLAEDDIEIPPDYSYHSTSLKPNWETKHLYCKN